MILGREKLKKFFPFRLFEQFQLEKSSIMTRISHCHHNKLSEINILEKYTEIGTLMLAQVV